MGLLFFLKKYTDYNQFLPKIEDLKNKELEKLSALLKQPSKIKTFINILEWQHNNIKYWNDRNIIFFILTILVFLSFLFLSQILKINFYLFYLILFLLVLLIFSGILLDIIYNLVFLFAMLLLLSVFVSLNLNKISLTKDIFLFFIFSSFVFGSFLSILTYLFKKYSSLKQNVNDFEISDTFKLSLPVEKILKYKLSICRDYAKLTSALLFSIYPDKEIYFVLIPQHVAVAIKHENNYFVLDQKLPILRLEKWLLYWQHKKNKKSITFSLIKASLNKDLKNEKINFSIIKPDLNYNIEKIDLEKVKTKVQSLLNLKTNKLKTNNKNNYEKFKKLNIEHKKTFYEIRIKNIFPYDSNDTLFIDSLARLIKKNLESELVDKINNLSDLEFLKNNNEFIIRCYD
ncbi:MAG: transglutaminase-like domain-containing protein [Candidatus Woesearchaeota archaeon]